MSWIKVFLLLRATETGQVTTRPEILNGGSCTYSLAKTISEINQIGVISTGVHAMSTNKEVDIPVVDVYEEITVNV